MTASIVFTGTIIGDLERKLTARGVPYVVATVQDTHVNWLLLAFEDDAQADLAAMRDGDEVEASGELKIRRFAGRMRFIVTTKRVTRVNASPEQAPAVRAVESADVSRKDARKAPAKARKPKPKVAPAKKPLAEARA